MKPNQHDIDLIQKLGGPSKVAELIGLDKQGGAQRVQNWLVRGIPAQMKVDFPSIFMPELAAAPATIAPPAIEVVAQTQPNKAPAPNALPDLAHGERERRERERRANERRASDDAPWHGVERRSPQAQPYPFPDIDRRAATESVTIKTQGRHDDYPQGPGLHHVP